MSANTNPSPAAAQLLNVAVRYDSGPEVLKNVNLTLPAGSFHFLTGPSGAGKTTLMRLLYLDLAPSGGAVSLFGRDRAALDRPALQRMRRRIGVVFQDFRLIPHMTVFDNVALPLRVAGAKPESYRDDVTALLKWVGLADKAAAPPAILSGGEKQRAAIARAIIAKPDLILADEPTGNVDPVMGDRLLNLFLELNRQGTAILIATHDPELVNAVEAPVLELGQGAITRVRRAA